MPFTQEKFTLLTVSPYLDDAKCLEGILGSKECSFRRSPSCSEAKEALLRMEPKVVICEKNLPDGDWRDILRSVRYFKESPPVVVISECADESLWAEVLNLGGYDVMLKPFEAAEVRRIIPMALRHGQRAHALAHAS